MKLYITPGSPYARIVRIVVLEKGLQDRVEIEVAKTRVADSPYYRLNPSGRVPYLVRDDGAGLEESALICAYLDQLDGKPMFAWPADDWESRRLEALARSMLDGFAVWARETRRPRDEQSPTILRHETQRGQRMLDLWEREVGRAQLGGALNMVQITLVCGVGFAALLPEFQWRTGHPKLSDWYDRLAARPSIAATAPPARH